MAASNRNDAASAAPIAALRTNGLIVTPWRLALIESFIIGARIVARWRGGGNCTRSTTKGIFLKTGRDNRMNDETKTEEGKGAATAVLRPRTPARKRAASRRRSSSCCT